jgi:hypothetical protein
MPKKYLSLALAATISCLLTQPAERARAQTVQDARAAEKIKADVAKIGAGARVSIKLRGKERLTGYVGEIKEQDFVVTKAREGTKRTVAYADVAEVKVKNEGRLSAKHGVLITLGTFWLLGLILNGGG